MVVAVVVLPAGGVAVVVTHGQVELPNLRVKRSHLTDGCGFYSLTPQVLAMIRIGCAYVVLESLTILRFVFTRNLSIHIMLQFARDCLLSKCIHKARRWNKISLGH